MDRSSLKIADVEKKFYTQKELAARWHITQSSVKNNRERGLLPYFQIPGSSRVLYPVAEIERIEAENTKRPAKEVRPKPKANRKLPEVSSTREWRI